MKKILISSIIALSMLTTGKMAYAFQSFSEIEQDEIGIWSCEVWSRKAAFSVPPCRLLLLTGENVKNLSKKIEARIKGISLSWLKEVEGID
jgi:hypothetical protein